MRSKAYIILILLAALKIVLPFLLQHPAFGLHRDEYLYYQQGQHPDWVYLENPGLIGWLASVSGWMGGSFFWIKFWPAVFGAATLLLTAGIAKELGARLFGQVVSALGIICSAYLRIHFLFQPNFLEIFCWTLAAYFLVRHINTQSNRYLYLLFAALALGLWSKYSVVFFALSIAGALLLTPYRKWYTRKSFWVAALLGLVLSLPNLWWQQQHQWPLFHHMQELRETQLQYVDSATFFKEQLLMLIPVAFVWIGGLIWILRNNKYRVIGLCFLLCIAMIALGSGKGYYTLGAYPMMLGAGGAWLQQLVRRTWLQVAVVLLEVVCTLPFVPLLLPLQPPAAMAASNKKYGLQKIGLLRWEDLQNHALQQDFADMIGWDELAQKAERAYHQLPPAAQQQTIVYCRSYGQAGALLYHAQDTRFRKKVICDNGTFLLWIPDSLHFRNLLFVGRDMPEKDDAVFQQFRSVQVLDSVTNSLSRQYGDKVILFRDAKDSAFILANQGLEEMKAVFGE
ncbi:Dolichyl-phosphate-mannose-protein mannosyltransferase [Cnuella takakiae]|uniref:Dolichyl-phosphate-mannose-protein mannosyltransferase n=1 Tax=Cnuella takakiae TaxID=1302690 RepID=A0A1M5HZB8_9BACT|nr:glycosyltransferase family 39 protein [Cnuella takakiae]OLY91406.1 hypothetical protein BUE76_05435 [Cnuella takakiae]SHG21143.1 Dolichyl-phosphate-mannose-protein mannosyltransferase [Cnuella takakiae]